MTDLPAQTCRTECEQEDAFKHDLIALVPHLRAFARTFTNNAAQADDLAQEALAKAWQSRRSYTMGTNMKAWLFMILRNQFYSEMRRAWRNVQLDQEAAEGSLLANDDPAAVLELNELRMALQGLPDDQREAIILIGAGGMSYEEAAQICDCPVGTVKSRVSRARHALRLILERGGYARDRLPAGQSMSSFFSEVAKLSGHESVAA